jgi:hypothetical protein
MSNSFNIFQHRPTCCYIFQHLSASTFKKQKQTFWTHQALQSGNRSETSHGFNLDETMHPNLEGSSLLRGGVHHWFFTLEMNMV